MLKLSVPDLEGPRQITFIGLVRTRGDGLGTVNTFSNMYSMMVAVCVGPGNGYGIELKSEERTALLYTGLPWGLTSSNDPAMEIFLFHLVHTGIRRDTNNSIIWASQPCPGSFASPPTPLVCSANKKQTEHAGTGSVRIV